MRPSRHPRRSGLVALLFPDPGERTKALGIWGGIAGLGGTLGSVISGVIVNIGPGSWRWIFLINIPVAAFALAVVPRLVDESRAQRLPVDPTGARPRPDIAGALDGDIRAHRDRLRHPARRPDVVGFRPGGRRWSSGWVC